MTKTLTEQWRDGGLKDGWYYVTSKQFGMLIDRFRDQINDCGDEWRGFDNCQGIADEILAPVPSYQEFVQQRDFVKDHQNVLIENMNLKRKLEIATKALKEYKHCENGSYANKALALIKEIK